MAGFCEHGNELSDCIKSEEFLGRGPTLVSASCRQIACKRRRTVSINLTSVQDARRYAGVKHSEQSPLTAQSTSAPANPHAISGVIQAPQPQFPDPA